MTFSVGYQDDAAWIKTVIARRGVVHDVYFAAPGWASGRALIKSEDRLLDDIGQIADAGLPLHLLFNATCYGGESLAMSFFSRIGETVERFAADGALEGVTTTSPLIARFVKDNFPDLKTRASVNMAIGTIEGMEYLADVFDGYCLKRELNRDLDAVLAAKTWCDTHGKELFILANSGCLNHCSSHMFHDNLVAHEAEIAQEDNGFAYRGTCWKWLAKPENRAKWMAQTNWIEPEDVVKYDGLCTAMKLATRINAHPVRILESYATGSHLGDIKGLLEPDHSALWR